MYKATALGVRLHRQQVALCRQEHGRYLPGRDEGREAGHRLRQLMSEMAGAVDNEARYIDLDVELHLQVAKTSRNTMMNLLVQSIREALRAGVRRGLELRRDHAQRAEVQALHEAVLAAIAKGDPNESALALARHFDDAIATIAHSRAELRS